MTTRLFLSTVTNEFLTCRMRLTEDLRFPDVVVESQEECITKIASGESILIKLDDYIRDCHAVIHLIGEQTGKDGGTANEHAVNDLIGCTATADRPAVTGRYPDFSSVVGISEAELRTLSYTQWEAWLAYYHVKKSNPKLKLIIAMPASGFVPDNSPDPAIAQHQKLSQSWHQIELQKRGRYSEITFADAKDLSIAILKALKGILPAQQPDQKIAESRLVSRHTTDFLYGRDAELKLLDDAWAARETVNVQCVIAWGSVGKTALLAHWVQTRFRSRGWKDELGWSEPLFYFDWTFYDQGTRSSDATQAGAASIGTFFVESLKHFGDPEPDKPDNKAQRLAALVQAHRSLIVLDGLDGLEPLQYPLNHPQAGQITDPDLAQFLRLLAQKNPGLCLISSREVLSELTSTGHLAANAPQKELDDLSRDAAISLLRKLRVTGSDDDLARAAIDYQHHALSLILLGRFLFTARGGDIRQRDTITFEKLDNKRDAQTRSAWHVLETYERWLQSPDGNPTDLQALRLVGVFDRPARPDCLDALRTAPVIPGLTDLLVPLDNDEWNAVLRRLHDAHLIQLRFPPREPNSHAPHPEPRTVPVDAHPLIREYFAKQLRKVGASVGVQALGTSASKSPEGYTPTPFETAHSRLFDHLCESTEHQPDSLDGLQPLYQAVVHGCLAGRHQEACEKVYRDRILRGTGRSGGFYSFKKLGANGADLGAVAAFFETRWSHLSTNLSEPAQSWLLHEAAIRLRSLGRLTEALEPIRVSSGKNEQAEQWNNCAAAASNLSELEVTLGELSSAVANARRAIDFADRIQPPDLLVRMFCRITAADALHQWGSGRIEKGEVGSMKDGDAGVDALKEARRLFDQAESFQRQNQPHFELLYSLQGFRYCDLILAPAERAAWKAHISKLTIDSSQYSSALAEAERRAKQTLEWMVQSGMGLLDIALDQLTLARVKLYGAMLAQPMTATATDSYSLPNLHPALQTSSDSLAALRQANQIQYLPLGLLTAAAAHYLCGDTAAACALLDEA